MPVAECKLENLECCGVQVAKTQLRESYRPWKTSQGRAGLAPRANLVDNETIKSSPLQLMFWQCDGMQQFPSGSTVSETNHPIQAFLDSSFFYRKN